MSSNKIKIGEVIIEIYNNWIGVQSIIINRETISKQFSFAGSEHYFTLLEDGVVIPYVLTTKRSSKKGAQMLVDLKRDGKMIKENVLISFITNKKENNKHKLRGIKFLKAYEIVEAIGAFKHGLEFDRSDAEIYFYLACCYSIEEDATKGFECLKLAIEYNLKDIHLILHHDMLAYLRIQEEFKVFLDVLRTS